MNQVEELVKVVAEAQADKGNVVIVTGKPGSGKSKVLREAAESQKWTYVDCRMLISEEFSDIESKMNDILSDLEWKVLMSYLDGKSYQEIAAELGRHIKSIDNALQRVKRKLEKYIISKGDITDLRTVYSGLLAIDPYERFKNKNS